MNLPMLKGAKGLSGKPERHCLSRYCYISGDFDDAVITLFIHCTTKGFDW